MRFFDLKCNLSTILVANAVQLRRVKEGSIQRFVCYSSNARRIQNHHWSIESFAMSRSPIATAFPGDDAECSSQNLIFTITDQLRHCPSFKFELVRALESHLDTEYSSLPYQLEKLIVNPLRAVGESFPLCVIVMDALDECKDGGATSIILSLLSRHVDKLSPLRILITGRPEQRFRRGDFFFRTPIFVAIVNVWKRD